MMTASRLSRLGAPWNTMLDDLAELAARLRPGARWPSIVIEERGGTWRCFRLRRGRLRHLADGPLEEIAARIRAQAPVPVELRLSTARLLSRTLRLPAASRRHVSAILPLQIERITPWASGHAVHAHALADDIVAGTDEIAVRVLAMSHPALEELTQRLGALGLKPAVVASAEEPLERRPAVDLLAANRRVSTRLRAAIGHGLAALVVLALVAATLAAYLAAVRHADLADATARLEAARAALEARQREAEADAGAQDILAPKYAGLPLVLLIDQLSAAVPGDTYLTELVAEEGRVRFSGLSADAGALITSIEDRTALDEVRFGASVIYDEAAQAERFEIQGRIGGGRS